MPGALSVTAVRRAVMFHISGGHAASLMLTCVRPCDRGPEDRDVERCARLAQLVRRREKKKRQEIPSRDTEGEKSRGRKFLRQQQRGRLYLARCFN